LRIPDLHLGYVEILWGKAPDPVNLPLNAELSFISLGMDARPWVLESSAPGREKLILRRQ